VLLVGDFNSGAPSVDGPNVLPAADALFTSQPSGGPMHGEHVIRGAPHCNPKALR
jgi:hypothetical protein